MRLLRFARKDSIGSTRREHYLGEDSQELLDQIDDEKALWESDTDDRESRQRLVNMLIGGEMTTPNRDEGKVLSLLERNGVFLAGAALVGNTAFSAYANMLSVDWASDVGLVATVNLSVPKRVTKYTAEYVLVYDNFQ